MTKGDDPEVSALVVVQVWCKLLVSALSQTVCHVLL